MKFAEYAPLALKTCKPMEHEEQVRHAVMGLFTEAGELIDSIKRHLIYAKTLDRVNAVEEIGDICWYFNLWCDEKRIAPKFLDDVLVMVDGTEQDMRTLDEHGIAIAQMVAAVSCPIAERGMPDTTIATLLVTMLATFCHRMGSSIDVALDKNIAKLQARFGDKYSDYAAINRDHAAERVILEDKAAMNSGDLASAMTRDGAGS